MAAWQPPVTQVLSATATGAHCPIPRVAKVVAEAKPDQELLLFMYGMKQGLRPWRQPASGKLQVKKLKTSRVGTDVLAFNLKLIAKLAALHNV